MHVADRAIVGLGWRRAEGIRIHRNTAARFSHRLRKPIVGKLPSYRLSREVEVAFGHCCTSDLILAYMNVFLTDLDTERRRSSLRPSRMG